MAGLSVRALAANVLVTVLRDGVYLNTGLRQLEPACVNQRDAALVQELCYGSLRFQPRLEFWLDKLLQQPLRQRDLDIHMLLLMGLYQLTEMRVPAHAVIYETAEACRALSKDWAVKLVNAVLRRFQREQTLFQTELSGNSEAFYAHPQWLIEHLQADWPNHWQSILVADNQRPPLTLRANRRLVTRDCFAGGICRRWHHSESLRIFRGRGDTGYARALWKACPVLRAANSQSRMRPRNWPPNCWMCSPACGCWMPARPPAARPVMCWSATRMQMTWWQWNRPSSATRKSTRTWNAWAFGQGQSATHCRPGDWWDGEPSTRILLDAPCSASGVVRRHPDVKALDVHRMSALLRRCRRPSWPRSGRC